MGGSFFHGASRGITIQLEPFRPARFPGASGVGRPSHKLRAHADGPAAGCGVTWRHSYTARVPYDAVQTSYAGEPAHVGRDVVCAGLRRGAAGGGLLRPSAPPLLPRARLARVR